MIYALSLIFTFGGVLHPFWPRGGIASACEQGDYAKAQQLLEREFVDDPQNPIIAYNLGVIYEQQGMYTDARKSYGIACAQTKNPVVRPYAFFNGANSVYKEVLVSLGDNWESKKLSDEVIHKAMAETQHALAWYDSIEENSGLHEVGAINKEHVLMLMRQLRAKQDRQTEQQNQEEHDQQKQCDNPQENSQGQGSEQQQGGQKNDSQQSDSKDKQSSNTKDSRNQKSEQSRDNHDNSDNSMNDSAEQNSEQNKEYGDNNSQAREQSQEPSAEQSEKEQQGASEEHGSDAQKNGETEQDASSANELGNLGEEEQEPQSENLVHGADNAGEQQEGEIQAQIASGAEEGKEALPVDMEMRRVRAVLDRLAKQEGNLQRAVVMHKTRGAQGGAASGQKNW